jgi:hypothetical protein
VAAIVWQHTDGFWQVDELEGIELEYRRYHLLRDAIEAISDEADRVNAAEVRRSGPG